MTAGYVGNPSSLIQFTGRSNTRPAFLSPLIPTVTLLWKNDNSCLLLSLQSKQCYKHPSLVGHRCAPYTHLLYVIQNIRRWSSGEIQQTHHRLLLHQGHSQVKMAVKEVAVRDSMAASTALHHCPDLCDGISGFLTVTVQRQITLGHYFEEFWSCRSPGRVSVWHTCEPLFWAMREESGVLWSSSCLWHAAQRATARRQVD